MSAVQPSTNVDHKSSMISPPSRSSPSTDVISGAITFTCFGELPAELRIMVWKHSIIPRVVPFIVSNHSSVLSSIEVPSILHTCFESRLLGLEFYQKIILDSELRFEHRFYVQEFDTFYLPGRPSDSLGLGIIDRILQMEVATLFKKKKEPLINKTRPVLRHFAIDLRSWNDYDLPISNGNQGCLPSFFPYKIFDNIIWMVTQALKNLLCSYDSIEEITVIIGRCSCASNSRRNWEFKAPGQTDEEVKMVSNLRKEFDKYVKNRSIYGRESFDRRSQSAITRTRGKRA